ncbi:alkaline phosphatase family protein [Methanolobus halotolerans]|uniref:alkaline phosphatase family protein n=1 Tax=Methanolobus halotolerans TaxID=2052935 RepID=UPI00143699CE|nr:alkaline phosphatase family protein [Methanolobus halotolerans]
MQPVNAYSVVEVNPVDTPHGAVILIVDGLSSSYIYPEFTPYALDGSVIGKASTPNISMIFDQSCRVLDVRAPQTYTEAGHSVLVTGYSKALSDTVEGTGTTIYDVAHEYDYSTFAIMQKGDFWSLRAKQDAIVHDASNSINRPEMMTDTNIRTTASKKISMDITTLMQENILILQPELEEFNEGSQERYDIYDNWAIETGIDVMDFMQSEYPDQPYLLTINVGAVDSAGHYKKDSGYLATIEGIDYACLSLYQKCRENNMAFIFTADHGMAFASADARGGHQSDKYARTDEAQKVPFVVSAIDVESTLIAGEYGQEDIAPTILEILDLPGELKFSDGEMIELKDHVSLRVNTPGKGKIIIESNDAIISEIDATDDCLFRGMEAGNEYVIRFVSDADTSQVLEKEIFLVKSESIDLRPAASAPENDISFQNPRNLIGGTLIGIINLTGFALIRRILKE